MNAILPGPIHTTRAISSNRREFGDDLAHGFAERSKAIPVGRFGSPDEVAAAVVFLASDGAGFVTGQALGVDGDGNDMTTANGATTTEAPGGAYRYIPGVFQYSAGVVASPGFRIERVTFQTRCRWTRASPSSNGTWRPRTCPPSPSAPANCAPPAPFTDAGFVAFNRLYCGTLERWGLMRGDANPVARSNVCPEVRKPAAPSFHAFCFARPAADAQASFVIAGSGEAEEGHATYRERTVRFGDTGTEGMRAKGVFVLDRMEQRMAAVNATWADTTAAQVYTVFDPHPFLKDEIDRRGAMDHGLTWHHARPPVQGLDYGNGLPLGGAGAAGARVRAGARWPVRGPGCSPSIPAPSIAIRGGVPFVRQNKRTVAAHEKDVPRRFMKLRTGSGKIAGRGNHVPNAPFLRCH